MAEAIILVHSYRKLMEAERTFFIGSQVHLTLAEFIFAMRLLSNTLQSLDPWYYIKTGLK